MAFKANKSSEGTNSFKQFIGVGSFTVAGINPTKAELEEFYGREIQNEPVYTEDVEINDKTYKRAYVTFLLELAPNKYKDNDGNYITFKTQVRFPLTRMPRVGSNTGKILVIDKYGRTAWGTPAEVEAVKPIMYSNGAANIATPYRKAYTGEDALVEFLIAYLNVANTRKYVNGSWEEKTGAELEECEASLSNIENYFKGDFSEIKELVADASENKVKILMGIRTNEEGKQFSTPFMGLFMKNGVNKDKVTGGYPYLQKKVDEFMARTTQNIIFECTDFHEHTIIPTDFSSEATNVAEEDVVASLVDGDPFASNIPF